MGPITVGMIDYAWLRARAGIAPPTGLVRVGPERPEPARSPAEPAPASADRR